MGELDVPKDSHNYVNAGLIFLTILTYILMITFNAIHGSGATDIGIFLSNQKNVSDKYELLITPAGFTFSIWGLIFATMAASLVMLVISIFVSNEKGRLYLFPVISTPSLTITISVNFLMNMSWIFLWDRSINDPNFTVASCVLLFVIALSNMLTIAILARNIAVNSEHFCRGSPMFLWGLGYRFMMNSWGIYTTWTIVASLVNLAIALIFVGEVDQRTACLGSLSLLVVIHCSWFLVENLLADDYVRFLLTPYLVIIWASNGIWQKKSDDPLVPQDVKDFVLSILIIASLTFIARLSLVIYRTLKTPFTRISTSSTASTIVSQVNITGSQESSP